MFTYNIDKSFSIMLTVHSYGSYMYIYPSHIGVYLYHLVFSFGSHVIHVYIPIVSFSLKHVDVFLVLCRFHYFGYC